MDPDKKSFRQRLRKLRPDVYERQEANALKRDIALKLRSLRDAADMTMEEVAAKSKMSLALIKRMEALAGPLASLTSIDQYVTACGGHWELVIRHGHKPEPTED
ncbi:hypothetical protein PARPLA_01544 [Rhodobacteraceae bacterium THAF1]|nr:hypothetical protein FIU81_02535 [Palleronia sp. THAF1]VDC22899.1 hypothetical protein PARPLA_01544 [Rhodobacteraceae bacterium THAF1]